MARTARQDQILGLVRQRGFVSIKALAERFEVTPQTIRRDINELCERELLRRYHGGAGLPSTVENIAYQARQVLHLAEKRRIAALAATLVPDRASLFLNIGATAEEVARALAGRRGLRVITNNLHAARILSEEDGSEVIVAGGVVSSRERGLVGEATVDFVGQFKVDLAVLGVGGIDPDGHLLDFDYREVRVTRAMMANARQVLVVADASKFGRNALVRIAPLAGAAGLVTEAPVPAGLRKLAQAAGVPLHVAAEGEAVGRPSATHAARQ